MKKTLILILQQFMNPDRQIDLEFLYKMLT